MRYKQMERIAARLRLHPADERFADDTRDMLYDLDSLQLLQTEWCVMHWYGDEVKTAKPVAHADPETAHTGASKPRPRAQQGAAICSDCDGRGWVRTRPGDNSSPRQTCRACSLRYTKPLM